MGPNHHPTQNKKEDFFVGKMLPGREAKHLPHLLLRLKMRRNMNPLPMYSS
jgi:hypothetical protein